MAFYVHDFTHPNYRIIKFMQDIRMIKAFPIHHILGPDLEIKIGGAEKNPRH